MDPNDKSASKNRSAADSPTTGSRNSLHHAHVNEWETTECTRLISIKDGAAPNLTVRSQLRGPAAYEVTITRRGTATGNLPYSLVNLGVQARNHSVWIIGVSHEITLSRPDEEAHFGPSNVPAGGFELERIVYAGSPNGNLAWLLNFGDIKECKLWLSVVRPKNSHPGPRTGHEISPPPPDPSGEN